MAADEAGRKLLTKFANRGRVQDMAALRRHNAENGQSEHFIDITRLPIHVPESTLT